MSRRFPLLLAGLIFGAVSYASAAYTVQREDGGSNTIVQGREYGFVLTSNPPVFDNIRILSNGAAPYQIVVGAGVQRGADIYKPDSSGRLSFILRVDGTPSLQLTFQNTQDPNIFTTLALSIQKYPVTFSITPPSPTVDAGVPFNIQIRAIDGDGSWVTAYEDSLQISDAQLGEVTGVLGTQFVGGVAAVPITIKAGNMNNQTTLTLTGLMQYYDPALPGDHFSPFPTFTSNLINVRPGAFYKLVMLFPGEVLLPGIGKDSSGILPQIAGVRVPEVRIYRVDSYYNPIPDTVSSNIHFQSSIGSDSLPADRTFTVPPLRILSTEPDPFIFPSNGNRTITATPDGTGSQADSSNVPVNPGAVFTYAFTQQPGSLYRPEDTITVRITAYDGVGAVLTTLNGPLTGARLMARLLPSGEEHVEWVDTNPVTDFPENVVNFNAGVALVNLCVTKRASRVQLHFLDPFLVGAVSDEFEVELGAARRVLLTVRGREGANPLIGQVYTPGTYPGNAGSIPTVVAGQRLIIEARVTDRGWNQFSDPFFDMLVQLTGENANNFLVATHPQGAQVRFDSQAELAYDADPQFDQSFRVYFRTAGPRQRVRAVAALGEFLSSTVTVIPGAYSRMVLRAPGETLVPGIDTEVDGKTGNVTQQRAGVSFGGTVYATDQFFNPVNAGPYPAVNFSITPILPGSYVSGTLPAQMFGGSRNFTMGLQASSDVRAYDNNNPTIYQIVSVPASYGVLHHFRMTLANSSDKEAGVPFQVTVQAEDEYNNVVGDFNQNINLLANTGATTMSPEVVRLTNGVFTGDLTMYAAGTDVRIQMSYNSVISQSPTFVVRTNSLNYRRLLLLLPGETMAPGTAIGKRGTPTATTVGLVSVVRAISCDLYYNPINTTGTVEFSSDHYAQFGAAGNRGDLVNVDGHGEFSTTMILRTAAVHTITVRDINLDGTVSRSTSTIQGLVGPYRKLQILAPGEGADPGTFVPTGKTPAAPLTQKAGVPFNVTLHAVDDYWNVVPTNGGDIHLEANITSVLFNPPNNEDTPGNDPRPFTNGVATREVIIGQQGLTQISVVDDANLTKPGQTVELQIDPGPVYVLTVPSTATAGQPFSATITLEESGVILTSYTGSIFLTASLASGGPASGNFNPDGSPREYVMHNGAITIGDLVYAYVERIKIRVGDNFGRAAFSNDIEVVPSGLKYRVNVPASAVAGPPSVFEVTVELLEENTNTLVKNHDHEINITVVSAQNQTTDGQYAVTSANLAQGVVTFQQSYTKAESIIIRASESPTAGEPTYVIPSKDSNNVNVRADGYKKLLLTAPGETHRPGVPSATGKTGVAYTRQVGVPFLMQVRGVDQYWNVANEFSGGRIVFTSSDGGLNAANPPNQNAPLVNGESASSMVIYTPGDQTVTVRDDNDVTIGIQSVKLTFGGNVYEIVVPPQVFAGAPFTMNVTVRDSLTGNIVTNANQTIEISALLMNGSPATGNLGVREATIFNGSAGILDQSYSIAEDIQLLVLEKTESVVKSRGTSSPIHVIPRQVKYTFEMPVKAQVNEPFRVVIRTIDQDTGTEVKNLERFCGLEAWSALTGMPVAGVFTPSGPDVVRISQGVAQIDATYTRTEPIFLKLTDNTPLGADSPPTQSVFTSQGSILITPGPLAILDIGDFEMQSNETRRFTIIARDRFLNPIPDQTLVFTVIKIELPGQMVLNGEINGLTQKTNGMGELEVTFDPSDEANGEVELTLRDGDRADGYMKLIRINVKGFPQFPRRAYELGDDRIPLNSTVLLDVKNITPEGGTVRTYYRVDGSQWVLYNPDTGILANDPSRGFPVFNEPRRYNIEYYSDICYDVACSNPVSEMAINGGPNVLALLTYDVPSKLTGYPSPFNPLQTYLTIQYPLSVPSTDEIDIYDLFGQKVWHKEVTSVPENDPMNPSIPSHARQPWFGVNDDGVLVGNGGYIVRVKVGATGEIFKSKILVVK
ncbi:MAG: hypothetical protein LHV69_07500 [Elusimicrobia bacterium]|nr:hypothetical protein [Candidatus Obscuribacterium magneticum]